MAIVRDATRKIFLPPKIPCDKQEKRKKAHLILHSEINDLNTIGKNPLPKTTKWKIKVPKYQNRFAQKNTNFGTFVPKLQRRLLPNNNIYVIDMADEKFFHSLINKVNGLYLLLITDRDGVPLLRVCQDKNVDFALMPSFIPTFTTASDQAGKLGLGRNKTTIISMYSNYQVVQMYKLPLLLTFVGAENCNTGHILALEDQLDAHLEDIKLAVCEA